MAIKPSAFSRPSRLSCRRLGSAVSESVHLGQKTKHVRDPLQRTLILYYDEDSFSDVPEFNCLARITGGLRFVYDGIRFGDCKSSLDGQTNSDGNFVPRLGMILASRYHILSHIKTSGQSAVLLEAKDSFRKMMPVVIKVMHTSYFAVGIKEVQTLRKITSADPRELSQIVRLLNSFRFESHICLVFPVLNPLPLTTVIAKKCHSKEQMLTVFRKISLRLLSALAFLKCENIIHADIKPDNILVHKDGDLEKGVTLIDFGNAIHHIHQEVSLYYTDFHLQTQPYRAPEVHLGNPFGVEVDMWSFGCVLLELLTGQLVFAGTDRADSLQKMIAVLGPLPSDMCKRGKFYPELASLLSKVSSSQKVESGALRLMTAFPCIRNYDFASFLSGLLTYHPDKRLTPWEALQHPFMAPEICIPYFLSDATKYSGVIKKSDYSFRQRISPHMHRLYPSTFDLLHAGTSDRPLIESTNMAVVEPFDLTSRPEKEVASQQKYDNRSPIKQDKVALGILSEVTTINGTEKCTSLSSERTTINRTEKCVSLPSERTTTNRTEKCVSLPSEMATAFRTEICGSSSSEMTTCRTEKCVYSDWVAKNSVFSDLVIKDTPKSKHELLHQRNTDTHRLSQPSVSKQKTTLLVDRDKKDYMNYTFNVNTNKSQNEVLEIGQSQNVNPSCKNTSECKTGTQSLSLDSKSHNGKLTCLANHNYTAGESLLIHTASSLNANAQDCQFQDSRLSKTDHCCEISEGATANAFVKKSEGVGTTTCLKSECVGTSNCLKSECIGTCNCLKSDSPAKKDSTYNKHTIVGTSASASKGHLATKSIQFKSFSRSKHDGSQVSSQVVTQDMCSQSLPLEIYSISHNLGVPKASKHHSAARLCSYADQVDSSPLGENGRDTSTGLQEHLIVKSYCQQEPQQVYKDTAVEKPVHEKDNVKNVVSYVTRNQPTNCFQAGKNGDEINQQSYLRHQTSSKITLSSPGRGKDTKNWQPQLRMPTIVKPDESIEKPHMTETDSYCKNSSEMHEQVVNIDWTKAIDTCHWFLDRDQHKVITSSNNESQKGFSLLNTTYVCARVKQKQPKISTVVSDHPNEMNPGFPCEMCIDQDINNCLHDSYTQEQKHLNALIQVSHHAHNKDKTGKTAQNLLDDFRTSSVIDTTSPVYNLNSSNTRAATGNQTERPVSAPHNCNKLTSLSKRKLGNEDTSRKELEMKPHNIIDSLLLPLSKTEEMQSKTKRQKLSRKAKSDCFYIKDVHHAINDPPSEVDIMKRQSRRRNLGQTDTPKGCTETAFIHKYPARSRNFASSTMETVAAQCTDNIDCRNPCQILEPGLETVTAQCTGNIDGRNLCQILEPGLETVAAQCTDNIDGRNLCQILEPGLETVTAQCTDKIDGRNPCQILESELSLLELPSAETKNDKVENNGAISDTVDRRGLLKLNVLGRKAQILQPSCKSQHKVPTVLLTANEEKEECREDSNFNVSCEKERPLSLRRTRKRKCVQEIDYYNQADRNVHKIKSRKELIFPSDSHSKEKNSNTKKLKTEMLKPNVQAKSQTVQEELLLTQKNSETLQTDNSEIETTQFKADVKNVSKILNMRGILNSRMAKRSTAFQNGINRAFKRNIKICLTNKSKNNLQAAQKRNIGEQLSDASRQLRAERVKRALSFNTKRSLQITNNGQFTITSKKSAERFSFPTPALQTENVLTHCGKENDCCELLDVQSSGSNNRTNSKSLRLSLPVGDLNSSDPYEFKVTPVKLQLKINANNVKQTKTACKKRSKLRSQTKKTSRPPPAADSVVCTATTVTIRDLVEQKSKYLFQDNNKIIPLAAVVTNNQQKCEDSDEKSFQTSEVHINPNQCNTVTKTELPRTERDMSVAKNRHVKTSPFQERQPGGVFENLPVSTQDERKLSCALNSSTSQNTPVMKVIVSKNSTLMTVNNKYSQSVASKEENTALRPLYFEKKLTENKRCVLNSETDELPVNCTSFPHHTRMDDYKAAGHDDLTVDFRPDLKLVSDNCNEEDSCTDEEVLLLD